MILTDCGCAELGAYFDGGRPEVARNLAEAEALIRRYKDRDLFNILNGLPPKFWGVHLNGKHCTEGPA